MYTKAALLNNSSSQSKVCHILDPQWSFSVSHDLTLCLDLDVWSLFVLYTVFLLDMFQGTFKPVMMGLQFLFLLPQVIDHFT